MRSLTFFSNADPNSVENLCSFYGRTDGTHAYFQTQDSSSGSCAPTVISNSGCKLATDISMDGGDCSNLTTPPTNFGTLDISSNSDTTAASFNTEAQALVNFDFAAAGISDLNFFSEQ